MGTSRQRAPGSRREIALSRRQPIGIPANHPDSSLYGYRRCNRREALLGVPRRCRGLEIRTRAMFAHRLRKVLVGGRRTVLSLGSARWTRRSALRERSTNEPVAHRNSALLMLAKTLKQMTETPRKHQTEHRQPSVSAIITWVGADRGGRRAPPLKREYRSVPRFSADPNGCLGSWDVNIVFKRTPNARTKKSTVTMSFLSRAAPRVLLTPGTRFELTEGPRVVAIGEVQPATERVEAGKTLLVPPSRRRSGAASLS
jgi:hypothetical protein